MRRDGHSTHPAAERGRETYQFYAEHGWCVACKTAKAVPGRKQCQACLDWRRDYNRDRRARLRAEHRCVRCGEECDAPTTRCARCQSEHNQTCERVVKARRAEGLCRDCGKPSAGAYMCPACREARSARRRREYEDLRARQRTCAHEEVRVRVQVVSVAGAVVTVRYRQRCLSCRQVAWKVFEADLARLQDYSRWVGWGGIDDNE